MEHGDLRRGSTAISPPSAPPHARALETSIKNAASILVTVAARSASWNWLRWKGKSRALSARRRSGSSQKALCPAARAPPRACHGSAPRRWSSGGSSQRPPSILGQFEGILQRVLVRLQHGALKPRLHSQLFGLFDLRLRYRPGRVL